MYKILIKYKSTLNKTFWYDHEVEQEDGTTAPFSTSDFEVLKSEIDKLDKEIGYENIRIFQDIDYDVLVELSVIDSGDIQIMTSADVNNIYNTAYAKIFSNGGA